MPPMRALLPLQLALLGSPAAVGIPPGWHPGGPGTPVAHDILVKNPSTLPPKLTVLDRADVNSSEWGYKSWIARVPSTGELLMTYSTNAKTLLAIRRSSADGAPGSWGAAELHPEISNDTDSKRSARDQEWSIHVLRDDTVLVSVSSPRFPPPPPPPPPPPHPPP
eukprot:COSAG04_NODE_776_length_10398_cov_2.756870_1_plen_164_part_10